MVQRTLEGLPTDEELVRLVVDLIAAAYSDVPFLFWLLAAFVAVRLAQWQRRRRGSHAPPSEEDAREAEPGRGGYTIHDDMPDESRTYRQPSESDDIVVTNEVDRSALGAIRRIIRGFGRSDRDAGER